MKTQVINEKQTIILYTYRYIWKDTNDKLCVKYLTEPQEGHAKFQKAILENASIKSCIREYVNEINFEYLGFTEPVKEEKKEEDKENKE